MTPLRIYVTGTIQVIREYDEPGPPLIVGESVLPGRQGRLVLAMLAIEHRRPVSRGELAEELWPGDPPPSWDLGVRAIVSKTRSAIARLGVDPIEGAFGAYRWIMATQSWLDIEEAERRVRRHVDEPVFLDVVNSGDRVRRHG